MVITELKSKLDNEFEKYYNIILVNGSWGIGKTYYLKNILEKKEHIYVSLFGIDKLDGLKFAVVIEDCDNLYYKLEKSESLEECILKYYLNDNFISGKLGIIRPIINIYKDDNTEVNYKKTLDYFIELIQNIKQSMKNHEYNAKIISNLFDTLGE